MNRQETFCCMVLKLGSLSEADVKNKWVLSYVRFKLSSTFVTYSMSSGYRLQ